MKKLFIIVVALSLAACGAVETGEVGVRTTFSGKVESDEMQQGIYTSFFSKVDIYSIKQIPVVLQDLKPKAGDNLRLQDFDVTVYYTINPKAVSETVVKYNNSNLVDENSVGYPAYKLLENLAKSAANDVVGKVPSMQLNDKRTELEQGIKESLQKELNVSDNGVFTIDRVAITNILTDPSVEKSIQAVAASENKKKEAANSLEVAKIQAEENRIRSQALDSKILAEKEIAVLDKLATTQNRVFVIPHDFKGIINAN